MTESSRRAWRIKPLLIVALVVALIAALGYAYASPYVALGRLKSAIDARDAQAISEYVDFPALRISLKQQVTEELMRRIDAMKKNSPFAVIGALIGSALIGPLVDAYATPEGVAALMSGLPPRGNPGERPPEWSNQPPANNASGNPPAAPPANPAPASAAVPGGNAAASAASSPAPAPAPPASPSETTQAPRQQQTSAGYRNIDEFVVTYQRSADGTRYAAIFHRFGLFSWKLSGIDLHA
ncbi:MULTISPECIES: DUF2939 domain-containing protein [Burkholderia]|uniref:DUF2939 domain-containing protein n=1 Tax=unclassified Burkholderia TaxID=2613784 RepID=UPI000B7A7F59|nr:MULTISPECIES: DUF2939 domain-containing protein [unclassified Burkholderia]MBR8234478.1 DUF2939 domain-containing protein [Burkholderia sp. AU32357]RQU16189.1 DUF2939 domain-containing protein [Burkholderia cenocepacia]MBY4874161.1 DUF2939 domain-containing protein [Burkholderia sp. AU42008]OXI45060.1 hypothetical protein CFB49_08415 [Burkholderia sp. AU17457]RQU21098.1 DUF2939 domain-containing protein [Burkholderia cenocepacia]